MNAHSERAPLSRCEFLTRFAFGAAATMLIARPRRLGAAPLGARRPQSNVTIGQFSDAGVREGRRVVPKVVKPESEWKRQLSPLAFAVTRHAATERAFSGAYWNLQAPGSSCSGE